MNEETIRNQWEMLLVKYPRLFLTSEEQWMKTLEGVYKYIESNESLPSDSSKDPIVKMLGSWISNQKGNYKKQIKSMNTPMIRDRWETLISKYPNLFKPIDQQWIETLTQLQQYIATNDSLPSSMSKDPIVKQLGNWVNNQKQNYKKQIGIMKDNTIMNQWETLMTNNPRLFQTNEDQWLETLEELYIYITTHESLPSQKSKDPTVKQLGQWVSQQKNNYKKQINSMKDQMIQNKWGQLINQYPRLFQTSDQQWIEKIEQVHEYITVHKSLPSEYSKDPAVKTLALWVSTQKQNYKKKIKTMKDPMIRNRWETLMTQYPIFFITKEQQRMETLHELQQFITMNDSLPSEKSKDPMVKQLGSWVSNQKQNYKKQIKSMKDKTFRTQWETLMNNYPRLFQTNEDQWMKKLDELQQFITMNDSLPSESSNDPIVKQLGQWCSDQKKNYKKQTYIMKDPMIRSQWTQLMTKYPRLFQSNEDSWMGTLKELQQHIDTNDSLPSGKSKDPTVKKLASWVSHQKTNYKKQTFIMKDPMIYNQWIQLMTKYPLLFSKSIQPKPKDMSKPTINPKNPTPQNKAHRQQRVQSEMSQLHQEYKTKNSQTLHTYFKQCPEKWKEYHKISKCNEASFPTEEIPRNKMIQYLERLPGKKPKIIADMGCGFAEINEHFKDNARYVFHNFDHQSDNERVQSRDIKNTGLDDYSIDIAILSLAMWGSNCKEYIHEAHRILDTGGTLLIAEPYKRWNKETDNEGEPVNKLVNLLKENEAAFTIIQTIEEKFMFIECRKN